MKLRREHQVSSPTRRMLLVVALALASAGATLFGADEADDAEARFRSEVSLARNLLAASRFEDSIDIFESANAMAGKQSAVCFLGMAVAHLRLGDLENARDDARRAVETATTTEERSEAHYLLGTALGGLDDGDGEGLAEAIEELRRAVDLEPERETYRFELGVALLRSGEDAPGIAELERFLEIAPGSARAEDARRFIEYPPRAHPDYAPEFAVVAESGRELSLANQRGRVLLLAFWATWSGSSRVSTVPWMKRLNEELVGEPFTLLGVSGDRNPGAFQAFLRENEMSWEQYRDADGSFTKALLPPNFRIPTLIVIDGRGVIRGVSQRMDRATLRRVKRTIEICLDELRGG